MRRSLNGHFLRIRKLRRTIIDFGRQCAAQISADRRTDRSTSVDLPNLTDSTVALVKVDGIGDFVLATGLLHLIHKKVPSKNVSLFCSHPVGRLARREFPDWNILELGARSSLWCKDNRIRSVLRSHARFDVLVELRALRALVDTLVASWIPGETKIGLACQQPRGTTRFWHEEAIFNILLKCEPPDIQEDICREIVNYRQVAEFLFPDSDNTNYLLPHLTVTEQQQRRLSGHLLTLFDFDVTRPFLLVCPGSLQKIKEYPVEALAQVIRAISEMLSIPIVVTGGKDDERTTKPLVNYLKDIRNLRNLSGRLDLEQHVVLTSMAKGVLTMDSASAHIAGALDRPAVVLLGGGYPGMFGPWGQSNRFRWLQNRVPCYGCSWQCIQDRPICVQDIPAELIQSNLIAVLAD